MPTILKITSSTITPTSPPKSEEIYSKINNHYKIKLNSISKIIKSSNRSNVKINMRNRFNFQRKSNFNLSTNKLNNSKYNITNSYIIRLFMSD